ncbi:cation diffusion facilitator family transporter [Anaerosalibacter massiliensis]|uniref:Cation diffusion facilitator family transporter n=1 Tax=Anaerosalibacter massiliensis TaxID=1347392 RepID=A0A9X2S475_9FIRM|nr:cation diffusion facilitator family transporter [Anaerosalibacter massiliensis]MCR2042989.1 cation diffusion facilitator family transporter [Anaerosalibacter massiliensis]
MENYKLGVKVSIITIIVNIILAVIKIFSGIVGKSNAMLADGVHTLSDVLTTFVVLLGLKVSSKEADENHPYGHEKYEPVFAKLLSIILVLTGIYIGYGSLKVLISGNIKTPGIIALVAALISIVFKEGMYWYTVKTARKIKSLSLEADAWHHRSDSLSSIGTFIGILGARMGVKILDPIAGIVVSIFVVKVGVELYLKATRELVDEAADEKTVEKIRSLTYSIKGVEEIRDLKTRVFGNRIYVDIDIAVNAFISVEEGHNIAEEVHDAIENRVESVKHCMVHVEPKKTQD